MTELISYSLHNNQRDMILSEMETHITTVIQSCLLRLEEMGFQLDTLIEHHSDDCIHVSDDTVYWFEAIYEILDSENKQSIFTIRVDVPESWHVINVKSYID
jgi:hypothetical protein